MAGDEQQARAEVERALEPFQNDLWLKRRLALGELIERLSSVASSGPQGERASARAAIFSEHIKFLEFLRDHCSGQQLASDKQWGQLLALMSVSRKVNHRSAKLRDILRSKQQIEANYKAIREFNESIRLRASIGRALDDLSANLGACQIGIGDVRRGDTPAGESARQARLRATHEAQLHLENLCGPLVCQLTTQLRATVSPAPSAMAVDQEDEALRERHRSLAAIFESLSQFVQSYQELQRGLLELEPLLSGLEAAGASREPPPRPPMAGGRNETLQNSLAQCKAQFARALELDQKILNVLRGQQQRTRPDARSTKQQQVAGGNSVLLVKLLDGGKARLKDAALVDGLAEATQVLRECQTTLGEVQQSLRLEFGRFYFINDLELLTVIALDVELVRSPDSSSGRARLVRKIFNNSISDFVLTEQGGGDGSESVFIRGVRNSLGELVELGDEPGDWVPLRKRVNIYSLEVVRVLNEVLRKLRRGLQRALMRSLAAWLAAGRFELRAPADDVEWTLPIQLLDLHEQVKFTQRVERALATRPTPSGLNELVAFYEAKLEALRALGDLTAGARSVEQPSRLKQSAAASLTVHFVSALVSLQEGAPRSVSDWRWLDSARFYRARPEASARDDPDGDLQDDDWQLEVRLGTAKFVYRFDLLEIACTAGGFDDPSRSQEMLNCNNINCVKRLVSTATSARCFLAASQAVARLRLGANPFGPAGAGKTETIKALGALLGCQVIVHNCDESNEARALERLVWGLAHTGLWGCFDEFNRLSASALSSVSATLELVQAKLRAPEGVGASTVELADGQIKPIDRAGAFFITLNPGDAAHYRGRRRLPANLRGLFLPIAMYRVQVDAIVREMLLNFGAQSGAARRHSSGLLSGQTAAALGAQLASWARAAQAELGQSEPGARCQFDLRLVLVILRRFFRLMSGAQNGQKLEPPPQTLSELLTRAIYAEVWPRLKSNERAAFARCVAAHGFELDASSRSELQLADRARQLEQQLESRAGVILLGASGSGKSTSWLRALTERNAAQPNSQICWFAVNPKAYDKGGLFGRAAAGERCKWLDGALTQLVRAATARLLESGARQRAEAWIVLDGAIDPDWIECLNSVLDDNQVLTLSSGERLHFNVAPGRAIKLLFETTSIQFASPATISRLGLVYHELPVGVDFFPMSERRSLKLVIVHGATASARRCLAEQAAAELAGGGEQARVLAYQCHAHANSSHLIELVELLATTSANRPIVCLLHDLQLVQGAPGDAWRARTFLEMLRDIVTYGRFHDARLERVHLNCELVRFVATVDSLSAGLRDERLAALATLVEAPPVCAAPGNERGAHETSYATCDEFLRAQAHSWAGREAVKVLLSANCVVSLRECATALKRGGGHDAAAENQPFEEVCRFNNAAEQASSLQKLADLFGVQEAPKRRRLFATNALELRLMDAQCKRQLCHALNMLRARQLLEHARAAFLVCLDVAPDEAASASDRKLDADASFWSLMGARFAIDAPQRSCGERLARALELKFGADASEPALEQRRRKWLVARAAQQAREWPVYEQDYLINLLVDMLASVREQAKCQARALANALERLAEFEATVARIEARRRREEEALGVEQAQIGLLMGQLDVKLRECASKRAQCEQVAALQRVKEVELKAQGEQLRVELAQVAPLLEASKLEVRRCLKPEALNEIRTLRAPPKTIKDILDVLLLLVFDARDPPWPVVKAHLTRSSLRDELTSFDFERQLDASKLALVERELANRRASFQLEQAQRASAAVVPIVRWIEAALAYGRAMVRSGPLRESSSRLAEESDALQASMGSLEAERRQLDEQLEAAQRQLEAQEASYARSLEAAQSIGRELAGAQAIIASARTQVARWRAKLAQAQRLDESGASKSADDDELALQRLCLICALFLAASSPARLNRLLELVRELEGEAQKMQDVRGEDKDDVGRLLASYVNVVLDIMEQDECLIDARGAQAADDDDERRAQRAQLELVRLKLFQLFQQADGPLAYCRVARARLASDAQLARLLGLKGLLCAAPDELLVVRPARGARDSWRAPLELGAQTGKLLAVECEQAAANLDVLDLAAAQLGARRRNERAPRIVLFGSSRPNHATSPLERALSTFELGGGGSGSECESDDDGAQGSKASEQRLAARLERALVQRLEPELGARVARLEAALRASQREAKSLEAQLMRRLMSAGAARIERDASLAALLQSELVRTLNELHETGAQLAASAAEMRNKLVELRASQRDYASLCARLARFSAAFVAPLERAHEFACAPPERLVGLLLDEARAGLNKPLAFGPAELQVVLVHLMCALRPGARREFCAKLGARKLDELVGAEEDARELVAGASRRAADLGALLTSLVAQCRVDDKSTIAARLAIVVHDETKPSPQALVDELFRSGSAQAGSARAISAEQCQYFKVYATTVAGGQGNQLEAQLRRIMTTPPSGAGERLKCVCIANAHLAASWLNANLLELMGAARCLFVLVAEDCGSFGGARENNGDGDDGSEPPDRLGRNLLEAASLKFWHDELALNALDRFHLYLGLLQRAPACETGGVGGATSALVTPPPPTTTRPSGVTNNSSNKKSTAAAASALLEDLILFHVACQELARAAGLAVPLDAAFRWRRDYNFDYEQLLLATRLLRQLDAELGAELGASNGALSGGGGGGEEARRAQLARLLDGIVYGSRLTTAEDEQLLARLLARFVRAPRAPDEPAERQLAQLISASERAASPGGGGGSSSEESATRTNYANELVKLIGVARD